MSGETIGRWEWLYDRLENPILLKELSGAFRRQRYLYLLSSLLGLGALVLLSSLLLAGAKQDASVVGRNAFRGFVWVELALVLLVFPAFSCTSIVEEKAGKRFDLLVTTRLTPEAIARGKLLAALLYGATFLIGTLPLVAITFLYGGVSVAQIFVTYLCLGLLALVVTAYGLMLSALAHNTARAVVGTFISLPVAVGLVAFPVILFWLGPFVHGPLTGDELWLERQEFLLRLGFIDTMLLLFAPLIWVGLWVWLFLTVAANGVRPESGDRATPLRAWFLTAWIVLLGVGSILLLEHPPPPSRPALLDQSLLTFFGSAWIMFTGAALVFSVSDPNQPWRPTPESWQRYLGRGAWAGAGFVSLVAVLSYTAAAAFVSLVPDISLLVARAGRRRPLEILLWGTLWSMAYILALTQASVWLSRRTGARSTRLFLLATIVLATALPVVGWINATPTSSGVPWDGSTLSPVTVLGGLTSRPHSGDMRLVLFAGPSGGGVEVHVASSALFLLIGLVLLVLNLRERPVEPVVHFREAARRQRLREVQERAMAPVPVELPSDLPQLPRASAIPPASSLPSGAALAAAQTVPLPTLPPMAPPPRARPPKPTGRYEPDETTLVLPAQEAEPEPSEEEAALSAAVAGVVADELGGGSAAEAESEPEPAAEPDREAAPEAAAEPAAEPVAEPEPEAEAAAEPEPEAEAAAEPEPETEPAAAAEPEPEAEPAAAAEPEPETEPESEAEPESEPRPSAEPVANPEARDEPGSDEDLISPPDDRSAP